MGYIKAALVGGLLLLAGCVTVNQGPAETVSLAENWVLLPFVNNTETPYAAKRAESIAAVLLRARGVGNLAIYPRAEKDDEVALGRNAEARAKALAWAARGSFRYGLTGTVNEWRYKVGLDGEPVVGVTLEILEFPEGRVVWSATGSKSGWSRDAVSAVAQQVMTTLLETVRAQR